MDHHDPSFSDSLIQLGHKRLIPREASRHLSGSAERLLATIEQSFSPAGEITSLPAIIRSLDTLPARIGLDTLDVIVAAGPVALEHRVKIQVAAFGTISPPLADHIGKAARPTNPPD